GGQSYNLIHVYPDRLVHSIVPIGTFPTTYEVKVSPEELAALAALGPQEREAVMMARDPGNA
ncbi:MAG: hypothetical protein REI45_11620, partial [Propionicimonas sp.]|nr:hypothetical protein [Propionicimonas sp.]